MPIHTLKEAGANIDAIGAYVVGDESRNSFHQYMKEWNQKE